MPADALPRAIGTVRGGIALAALAAALMVAGTTMDLVSGPGAGGDAHIADADGSLVVLAVVACVVLAAGAALTVLWLHLAGMVVATGVALISAVLVIVARTSDGFAGDADVALEAGGWLLVAAFWIALAGIVVALVGFRMVALAAPPPTMPRKGPAPRARTAGLAGALGAAGVVIVVSAALAVAYGVLALGDIRASGERLEGRGTALAGVALGILVLSLLAAVGGVGTLVASPG